jgi:putative FmdB family regulatory protein
MPLYEYQCKQCGKTTEFLENTNQTQAKHKCPACNSNQMVKLLSMPAGVIIKKGNATASSGGTCCGSTSPCSAPKHCCGGHA